jgi:hypothetical protein
MKQLIKNILKEYSINEGTKPHPKEEEFKKYQRSIDDIVYSIVDKDDLCGYSTKYFLILDLNAVDVSLHYKKGKITDLETLWRIKAELRDALETYLPIFDKAYVSFDTKCNKTIKENKDTEIEKNLKAINVLLSLVSWNGLCDIWVDYDQNDMHYNIRSKTIKSYFEDNDIEQELESLENSLRSMGIRVYVYIPWYVENCEDEVRFLNEAKYNSQKKIIENVLNTIVLPEYEHVICGFEVKEPNERFNTVGTNPFKNTSVTVTFIGGTGTKLWPQTQGVQRMYDDILDEVWDVIYNYTNEGVDMYHKTVKDCGKENIYLRESKEEDNKLKLVKDLIYTLFDEIKFIEIKKYNNKPLLKIYFESESVSYDTEEFGVNIYKSIYDYTGIIVPPSWAKSLSNAADFYLYCEHIEYDDEGNVIN